MDLASWLRNRRQRRRDRRALLVLWAVRDAGPVTGLGVMGVTDLPAGAAHGTLYRLEGNGLVTSAWETPQPRPDGRPRRRYYAITPAGEARAAELVDELSRALAPSRKIHHAPRP